MKSWIWIRNETYADLLAQLLPFLKFLSTVFVCPCASIFPEIHAGTARGVPARGTQPGVCRVPEERPPGRVSDPPHIWSL